MDEKPTLHLKIPDELHTKLVEKAEQEYRSKANLALKLIKDGLQS